ncbi:MAG: response regulator transcription factor [Proteobacteria bacterium]|nr:MAG: response regulator transcription factor [Pseudomonadota bacterium]
MKHILVVEDSPEAFKLIELSIGTLAKLEWAKSCAQAFDALGRVNFDLVILVGGLPDGDGIQLCSIMQTQESWAGIPVVILTARNATVDKFMAFSVGADDFITKPFESLELRARVESKLRKRERSSQDLDVIRCGPLELSKNTQRAFKTEAGERVLLELSSLEFKLLVYFAGHPDVVLSRDQILNSVWGENRYVDSRAVDTHVSKLRKKMGLVNDVITSVYGTGYSFSVANLPKPQLLDLTDAVIKDSQGTLPGITRKSDS